MSTRLSVILIAWIGTACATASEPGARLVVSDASSIRSAASVYKNSYAVVIGINEYQDMPSLSGAVRDAQAMAVELERQGFEVTLLTDADATRDNVREELGDKLPTRVGVDDRVLVYFAGHAASVGAEGAKSGYIMPVDGDSGRPVTTGIAMSELQLWFADYPSKHVLFLADACYSGLALSTRSAGLSAAAKSYLKEITSRNVRFTMVAGRDDQQAHEWQNQGVFTRFLLNGMAGAADLNGDELVTSDELATYVRPQVSELVQSQFRASQTPQSARFGLGEFVFFPRLPDPTPAERREDVEGRASQAERPEAQSVAQTPPAAEDATSPELEPREWFQRGEVAYMRGDYQLAVQAWQNAYAADPRPRIQYNVYQAYERMGNLESALEALNRYITTADPEDPYYADAEARFARLNLRLEQTGLVVNVDVEGAEILIDGEKRGVAPHPELFRLPPGQHVVNVIRRGYRRYETMVLIVAGQAIKLDVKLGPRLK